MNPFFFKHSWYDSFRVLVKITLYFQLKPQFCPGLQIYTSLTWEMFHFCLIRPSVSMNFTYIIWRFVFFPFKLCSGTVLDVLRGYRKRPSLWIISWNFQNIWVESSSKDTLRKADDELWKITSPLSLFSNSMAGFL